MEKMLTQHQHWLVQADDDQILWLLLNRADSQVNTLNAEVLSEFSHILRDIANDKTLKGVIISSAKKTGFIAGADITQFEKLTSEQEAYQLIRQGQEIFDQLEQLPLPTVALIEGFCVGGGLELALACKYRIAETSAKTRIGLPEVKLGIHPGWGGSVRLPKLVGPLKAMEVILTGRTYTAQAAKKIGMVDEALPKRLLDKAAKAYIFNPPQRSKKRWQAWLEMPAFRPLLAKWFLRQLHQKINPLHYPAPFKVVENWQEVGTESGAMEKEAQSISQLLVSNTARNLVSVFFLQENLKSLGKKIDFHPQHVHVVGAGIMGGDIAAWCALKGFQVTLQDHTPKVIGNAIKRAYSLATKQLKEKHLVQAMMDRLLPDPHGVGITKADVIIEAIYENLPAKQDLFAHIEKQAKPEAIFATNTSTIPLEEIGANLTQPERLVGMHFFNPVAKMQLVEIVQGKHTDPIVSEQAMAFAKKIDRLPLPVKSAPGFLVNRILLPYMLEAFLLWEEGVPGPVIDKAAVEFGMPMGPIELADAVGLDICLAALQRMGYTEDHPAIAKLKQHVSQGNLGRKTGKGFYHYKKDRTIKPAIAESQPIPPDIKDRLILRLLNEAISCWRERIVKSIDLLDAGCIFGFGFPPFRGGPMAYIKSQGQEQLLAQLKEFEARYGERFTADEGWHSELIS